MPIKGNNNIIKTGSDLFISSGTAIKPTITYNNGGTVDIGEGTYRFFHSINYTGSISEHIISETTISIPDLTTSYIVADYNSGNPEYSTTTDLASINFSSNIAVYTISRVGDTNIDILDWDEPAYALGNKLLRRDMETRRFDRINGLTLSEDVGRKIIISSGAVWQGSYRNSRIQVDSIINNCILVTTNGTGWNNVSITAYNNSQYDNGSGVTTLTDGKYAVNWIYRGMGINAESIIVFLGTDDYTLDQAKSSQPPNVPVSVSTNAMLVGKIIVLKGESTAIQIDSAFQTLFAPASASNGVVIGSVQMFAGLVAPSGYHLCDGSAISRETYSALFNVIGINYGAGNGSTTFNLPNLKGKVPVGYDNSQSEFDTLGKSGGAKTHTLTTPEMPSHNHTFQAWNNTNTDTSDIFTNDWRLDPGSGTWGTSNTGGGQAHNNLQPYLVMSYVIRY